MSERRERCEPFSGKVSKIFFKMLPYYRKYDNVIFAKLYRKKRFKVYTTKLTLEQVTFLRSKPNASEYLRVLLTETIAQEKLATARPTEKIILLNERIGTIRATIEKLSRNPDFLKSQGPKTSILF